MKSSPRLPGLTEDEQRDLVLSVGTHRTNRRLSPVEVGEMFRAALDAGASLEDCAKVTHLDGPTMVNRFLRVGELPSTVAHLIDWGESDQDCVSFSSAVEVAKAPAESRAALSVAILEHSLTKKEVVSIRQLLERSGDDLPRCVERVVSRRPIRRHIEVIMGAISDPRVLGAVQALPQRERNELLRGAIEELTGFDGAFTARLGRGVFTLVGPPDFSASMSRLRNPEAQVSSAVSRQLPA
jgi:hypothetical protein